MSPHTIPDLRNRILIAKVIIRILNDEPDMLKDLRQPNAIKHYQAQLLKLETELYTLIEPEPIVIGLQPGRLSASSSNIKE